MASRVPTIEFFICDMVVRRSFKNIYSVIGVMNPYPCIESGTSVSYTYPVRVRVIAIGILQKFVSSFVIH